MANPRPRVAPPHKGLEHPRVGVVLGLSGMVGIAVPLMDHKFILLGFLICWGSAVAICILYFSEWKFGLCKFKKPVGYQKAADKRPVARDAIISPIFSAIYFFAPILIYFGDAPSGDPILEWGAAGREEFKQGDLSSYRGPQASRLVADGKLIEQMVGNKYRLIGIGIHHFGTMDILDETNLSKSGAFDITPTRIEIIIPWSDAFFKERVAGLGPTSYLLLAVPAQAADKKFTMLRQVIASGGRILGAKSGPP